VGPRAGRVPDGVLPPGRDRARLHDGGASHPQPGGEAGRLLRPGRGRHAGRPGRDRLRHQPARGEAVEGHALP
jgi:hypothetical protein